MLSPGWAAADVSRVSDRAWIQEALRVESALAVYQAGFGIIPAQAAATIERVAGSLQVDPRSLAQGVYEASNSAIALVKTLQAAVDREAPGTSDYVHVGATSQDILDSASILVCAEALLQMQWNLAAAHGHLVELMRRHGAARRPWWAEPYPSTPCPWPSG